MNPRTLNAVFSKLQKKEKTELATHRVELAVLDDIKQDADILFDLMERSGWEHHMNDMDMIRKKLSMIIKDASRDANQMESLAKSLKAGINKAKPALEKLGLDTGQLRDAEETLDTWDTLQKKAMISLVKGANQAIKALG